MLGTPQQEAMFILEKIVRWQHEPGYLDILTCLRQRLDGEIARVLALRDGGPVGSVQPYNGATDRPRFDQIAGDVSHPAGVPGQYGRGEG